MNLSGPELTSSLLDDELSRKEKVLLLLASGENGEKSVRDLKQIAMRHGFRAIRNWNVSQVLRDLGNAAARLQEGWVITDEGRSVLNDLGLVDSGPIRKVEPTLRRHLRHISSPHVKAFVEEAVQALELRLYRSAVVLSWQGAVSVLYQVVLHSYLEAFNAEMTRRNPKWKAARALDDLAAVREYDFLQVVAALSVVGKNTKQELEHCLQLRNACGHPNTFVVGEHRVASHIEVLILNAYSRFDV